jgi:Uma2 family endonuclease
VKEYWLIDPHNRQTKFFRLDKKGRTGCLPRMKTDSEMLNNGIFPAVF